MRVHLCDQRVYDVGLVSGLQYVHPCDVGVETTKHRIRDRRVDRQSELNRQYRRTLPGVWRRRATECGHLSGRE